VCGEFLERTVMFVNHAGVLLLERCEFGAGIFCLVLTSNYTMSEPLEFGVALPNVLLKSYDAVVGRL
jgi:hypothetical protein